MFKAFLVKYAEIGIKGKNRYLFEDALIRQMEYVLKPVEGTFHVTKEQGRIYVLTEGDFDYEEALEALKRVFGIAYICPVVIKEDQGYEQLEKDVVAIWIMYIRIKINHSKCMSVVQRRPILEHLWN